MERVLLVDDRPDNRRTMAALLAHAGYGVEEAASVPEALSRLRAGLVDVVLSDVRMDAEDDGLTLLRTITARVSHPPVILYTGAPRTRDAVRSMKLGASDYLELPVDPDVFLLALANAIVANPGRRTAVDSQELVAGLSHQVLAASPAMRAILDWARRIGRTDLAVLLTGETGTGKELIARAVHASSARSERSFVVVNCGAVPKELLEAELFGHQKGAFTGALADKAGLLEEAHRGTLFLDEVGEMLPSMQVALLRFLEDGEVRRPGATKVRYLDVRVITATNRDLRGLVARGGFRSDLYFRLNVADCHIPPLRERPEDLDALVATWLPRLAEHLASRVCDVTPGALARLRGHGWPGNVRELRNVLQRALTAASGDVLTEQDVAAALGSDFLGREQGHPGLSQKEEPHRLLEALERHHWNRASAAASLGISRSTLWRKLRRYGLGRVNERASLT